MPCEAQKAVPENDLCNGCVPNVEGVVRSGFITGVRTCNTADCAET